MTHAELFTRIKEVRCREPANEGTQRRDTRQNFEKDGEMRPKSSKPVKCGQKLTIRARNWGKRLKFEKVKFRQFSQTPPSQRWGRHASEKARVLM